MILLSIASLLIGAVFGLRFRVFAVVPATACAALMVCVGGLILGRSGSTIVLEIISSALCLQGGYVFGSATRFTIAAARAARSVPAVAPVKATR